MTTLISLSDTVNQIMTANPVVVTPKMLMTEVVAIFKKEPFHHLPVVDQNNKAIGIISESDVLQLQDKFTRFNCTGSDVVNRKYFDSLMVSEVMTPDPVSVSVDSSISALLDIFIDQRMRSAVVHDQQKCVGIVTPFDILMMVREHF